MAWREESSPAFRRPEGEAPAPVMDAIVVGSTMRIIVIMSTNANGGDMAAGVAVPPLLMMTMTMTLTAEHL
jgi:hypothetical protein